MKFNVVAELQYVVKRELLMVSEVQILYFSVFTLRFYVVKAIRNFGEIYHVDKE
ncbi:hypothetical protein [Maribacter cobaltidurans]|uniref:hypothetical protein n=1 Tax=Maribacter cobaltidurans TaxID=1178778 RepID=UPI00166571B9|nr:hypothetical protein [Maribacter cobaltidurans]